MISVVILTHNEETNIGRCLDSVSWSDDILVVDSFSEDRTVEISKRQGARVIQRAFEDFSSQRNFASEQGNLKYEWLLHLDADEIVSPELRAELLAAVLGDKDAYRVSSKLIFRGKFLRHAGLFPWYQVRFGRKQALRFKQVGHGQRETLEPSRIGTLKSSLLHFNFSKGLPDWIERHNRYSTAEAHQNVYGNADDDVPISDLLSTATDRRRRAAKKIFRRLPCRAAIRFIYMYLFRGGILDGEPGLTYCRLLAWYEWLIVLKEREIRARVRAQISDEPRRHARDRKR
jgi:glycosyltransferase involved in cell wall biosynthesis